MHYLWESHYPYGRWLDKAYDDGSDGQASPQFGRDLSIAFRR